MLKRKRKLSARIFIPADVQDLIGRREVWRSTRTGDPRSAKLRASIWRHHFETLFIQLAKARRTMTTNQISALVSAYLDARLDDVEERLVADLPGLTEVDLDMWQTSLVEKLELAEYQLIYGDLGATLEQAAQMLPGGSDTAVSILARRLLEALYDTWHAELLALQGKPLRRARIAFRDPSESASAPRSAPQVTPPLSEVCDEFIATTGTAQNWRVKTKAARRQAANLLVDFLEDKPVGSVTRKRMTQAYLQLPKVPTHYTKRYPQMPPTAAIAAADKAGDDDRYSPKTCNLRLETWKAVFRYAVDHEIIEKSPADHLKAFAEGRGQDARDAFTDEQLRAFLALLKTEAEKHPAHYWVARVMAYTGLRLEEAAALRPCDVREVDGVLCVEVSREAGQIKTDNAARFVPVHSALRVDLQKHVGRLQEKPQGNLWGLTADRHGKRSGALSKRLNKRLAVAIPGKSKKLVLESLRNTFATKLKAADVQEHAISELMGHAVSSLAVGRYGKKLEPAKLFVHIEKLSIPEV
jgi:integrase